MPARPSLRGRALPPRLVLLGLCSALVLGTAPSAYARPVPVAVQPRSQAWKSPLAPDKAPIPTGDIVCGSSRDRTFEVLAAHAAWQASAPEALPTTQSYDHGDIAVIEDDGTMLKPSAAGHVEADEVAVARAFYRTHGDDYDYLCLYTASSVPSWVLSGHAAAFEMNINQDVQGLGQPLYDLSLDMGSLTSHLHSMLELNNLTYYPDDPMQDFVVSNNTMDVLGHEAMHRWGAYVHTDSAGVDTWSLLESNQAHWQFFLDDQASELGGNQWQNNGDGTWTSVDATRRYGQLERYLAGFDAPSEVDSITILGNSQNCSPLTSYSRDHNPEIGISCQMQPYKLSIQDVIQANGARLPDTTTSQKTHRFAFLLLIGNGTAPADSDLAKINQIRTLWPSYFSDLTGGRGTAVVTLVHHAGSVAVDADRVPDSESPTDSHPVTARASIVPGSLPLALDSGSVSVSYAVNGGGLTSLPMSEGPAGTFTAAIPPEPLGSKVSYFVHALSDSSGIEGWWPAGAPAVRDTFVVGPDLTPPSISFLSPPAEVKFGLLPYRFRAKASDNLGLARVFATAAVNDGPRDTLDMTREGASDTFYVDVYPQLQPGDRLSIDAHAVDASAAHHETVSPQCPYPGCGFEWGYDWIEPLDVSNGGFTSSAISYLTLDSWNWTSQSDATGGSSWKCGDPGPLNYIGDLDAGLVTPALFLTGNADLHFRHRYDLEEASPGVAYDGAVVEMSVRGAAWTQITPTGGYPDVLSPYDNLWIPSGTPVYSGMSPGFGAGTWADADFPVSASDTETVRFRLRMVSDDSVGGAGWFVDDFRLVMASSPVAVGGKPAAGLSFLAPEPNPARRLVRFAGELPEPEKLTLEIFDAAGRRVSLAFHGALPAGPWSLAWAPADQSGPGAGIYFARLTTIGASGRTSSLSRRFVFLP